FCFFFQAEDGIRDRNVTGVQTCALPIYWSLFFPFGEAPRRGPRRVQPAYKIDTSLVDPLHDLPRPVTEPPSSLAARDLLRGLRMGLPSGQAVAHRMGLEPIPDGELRVGKATVEDSPGNPRLVDVSAAFRKNAPLW